MPLITGITYGGIVSYIKFHGLLANATKALQGSAFQQSQIKIAQAIAKLSPYQQMKALGFTEAQVLAWQKTQQAIQTSPITPVGSQPTQPTQPIQPTSNGCMVKEAYQQQGLPAMPQHHVEPSIVGKICPVGYIWDLVDQKCKRKVMIV